tara:strand:+ start:978 stop:2096 length:1119 start_codon:yes stop_codon:yes gene_type:complete
MGFITSAVIGGAAKRASEILDEERKEAISMTEDALKTWTQLGLPKAADRRKNRLADRKLAKSLEQDYGFNVDQIAVIMGQGKGDATRTFIDKQRSDHGQAYKVPYGDIVTISGTYEDTGLTIDKIIDNIHGKVNRGMSTSDAIKDVTGKEYTGGLTGLLGGDNSALMRQKMDAFGIAAGVDVNELRALASDDITYDDPLRKGTVSLYDASDDPLKVSFLNRFEKAAVIGLGGKANIVDGNVVTEEMDNTRTQQSIGISAMANKKFKELQKDGTMSETQAYQETLKYIEQQTQRLRTGGLNDNTANSLAGLDVSQLPGKIESLLKGETETKKIISLQIAAKKALEEAYRKSGSRNPEQDAERAMENIRKRLED